MTRRYATGRLDALVQMRNGWRRGQRQRLAARIGPSWVAREPHWACPSCGIACRCEGAARALAHRDCGEWAL